MASKKTQGRPKAVPAPAATAMPPLPDGFERINDDDDGDELVQPTPKQAVADLLDVLLSLPPWERFPADPDEWTPSQIRERGRPRPGHVMVADVAKDGDAFAIELRDDRGQNERLVRAWEQRTGRRRTKAAPTIMRSPIDKRRQLHDGFDVFVPQAIKAVVAAGGNAAPLRELERDDELHADTVAAAVVELRKLTTPAVEAAASAPPPAPMPDLGHEERETLQALREGPLETSALDKRRSTKRARARLRSWLIEQCGNGSSKRGYWRLLPDGRAVLARIDAGE